MYKNIILKRAAGVWQHFGSSRAGAKWALRRAALDQSRTSPGLAQARPLASPGPAWGQPWAHPGPNLGQPWTLD